MEKKRQLYSQVKSTYSCWFCFFHFEKACGATVLVTVYIPHMLTFTMIVFVGKWFVNFPSISKQNRIPSPPDPALPPYSCLCVKGFLSVPTRSAQELDPGAQARCPASESQEEGTACVDSALETRVRPLRGKTTLGDCSLHSLQNMAGICWGHFCADVWPR